MSGRRTRLDMALEYHEAGLNVLPVKADGSKSPSIKWADYKTQRVTKKEVEAWFKGQDEIGIAVVCGEVSGGVEVLDFDQPGYYARWLEVVKAQCDEEDEGVFGELPTVATPGSGHHVFLRSPKPQPGMKLAMVEAPGTGKGSNRTWVEAIESRGTGQIAVLPGSHPKCHPTGNEYEQIGGTDILEVPTLAEKQRDFLFEAAKSLTRFVRPSRVVGEPKTSQDSQPGTDYSTRGDWAELLEKHNWTLVRTNRSQVEFWQRPGKTGRGASATVGHCETESGVPLFYVFSSNADPFQPDRAYTLFGALAILEHERDFKACAKRLASEGYGKTEGQAEIEEEVKEAIEEVRKAAVTEQCVYPKGVLDAHLENDRQFKQTWERKRREEFGFDASRYDTAIVWFGVQMNWGIKEIISMVFDHRRKHKDKPEKALEVPYIAAKIAWIRSRMNRSEKEVMSHIEAEETAAGGDDEIINQIRARTGVEDFVGITQYGTEKPRFELVLTDGRVVNLGSSKVVLEWRRFHDRIFDALGVLVPAHKNWQWEVNVQLFLRIINRHDMVELEFIPLLREWLQEYLFRVQIFEENEWQDAPPSDSPFRRNGMLYVRPSAFCRWVRSSQDEVCGRDKLYSGLRSIGFNPHNVSCLVNDKQTSRNYYRRHGEGI